MSAPAISAIDIEQRPARTGRIQEFGLLVIVFLILELGWFLTDYAFAEDQLAYTAPAGFTKVSLLGAIVIFGGHFLIRYFAKWADPVIYPSAVLLTGIGFVVIHRVDFSLIAAGAAGAEVGGQMLLALLGFTAMLVTLGVLRDHRKLRRFTYISLILGIFLLLLPLVPGIGSQFQGARIWIRVFGFSFQPAEIGKICLVIFFAGYLVVQRDNLALAGKKILGLQLPQLRHFAPIMVAWIFSLGVLAFENDFGTALLVFGLFVAMLYIATERISWIVIGGLLSAVGVWVIVQLRPHIQARFNVWLHAFEQDVYDAKGGSYQIVQGWFGMASGGLTGTGLGEGYPTRAYAANSDMIIASIAEELGLAGAFAILVIYLVIIFRALKTGIHLRDGFGKLLAGGLGAVLAIQVFLIVGGITRVIPLTGLALPFLALGGSALLSNWIIIGILLRMSDDARRPYGTENKPLSTLSTADLAPVLGDPENATDTGQSRENFTDAFATASENDFTDGEKTEVVRL